MSRSSKSKEQKPKKRPGATRVTARSTSNGGSRVGSHGRPKARASSIAPPPPAVASAIPSPAVPAPQAVPVLEPIARVARPPRARPSTLPRAEASVGPAAYDDELPTIEPAQILSALSGPHVAPDATASTFDAVAAAYEDETTGPFHTPIIEDPLAVTSELDVAQPWSALAESATAVMVPPTIDDSRVPTGPEPSTESATPSNERSGPSAPRDVEGEIREIEARLDELLRQSGRHREPAPRVGARALVPSDREDDEGIFGTAGRLLSTDHYLRQWGRLGMRTRAEEVDEFGLDRVYEARVMPLLEFAYRRYFRVDATGVANVPTEGACLLVSNHSGTVPLDGPMIRLAVQREHPARREVRWLAEDIVYHFPFAGAFATRIGAVRACQENAERLLLGDRLVAVFPEGIKGISKLFRHRYKLQRFGRGGYVKLALRTRAPIVPVAVVGGEETNPMLYRLQYLARGLGLPYIPVTPTFPWLGPLGLVPAPTKWSIRFGEPIVLDEHSPEDADDPIVVSRLNERVRTTIQSMLDGAVSARKSIFFG